MKSPSAPHNSLNLLLDYLDTKIRVKFIGSCLKQGKITYTQKKVNIYIVYELNKKCNTVNPTLVNCFFGAVKLIKDPDIDQQYKYSGYGIEFDRRSVYSFGNGFDRNVIIFGADMSSSRKIENRNKEILILGKQMVLHYLQKNCIQLILLKI